MEPRWYDAPLGATGAAAGINVALARHEDVSQLRAMVNHMKPGSYVVVTGPKGVGKTTIVDTALEKTAGVVRVDVGVGQDSDAIKAKVERAVSGVLNTGLSPTYSAKRVMWSYRLIFHKPLVVVLSVEEVKPGETFASVDGAARSLARICRPVIDASNNSLPEPSKATMRERVLVVDDMSRTVLNSMPTLQKLLSVLKKYELGDLTWAVIGGVPANYLHLVDALEEVGESKERDVVFGFVRLALVRAIATRVDAPANRALYEFFKERNLAKLPVPYDKPASMGLARPTPDKVLRVVYLPNKDAVLAPATPAMAVVLYHDLQAATLPETAEALKALLGLPEKDEAPVASTL